MDTNYEYAGFARGTLVCDGLCILIAVVIFQRNLADVTAFENVNLHDFTEVFEDDNTFRILDVFVFNVYDRSSE